MACWRPPEKKDYGGVFSVAQNLRSLLSGIAAHEPLNPIVQIASYDYLGLTLQKLGTRKQVNGPEAVAYLRESKEAFLRCLDLADRFDDPQLPLWRGYATFNLARTLHELERWEPTPETEFRWRQLFHEALTIRESWTRQPYALPTEIEEGFMTEYLHAKAERIRCARSDEAGRLTEEFPYQVDAEFVRQAELEYQQWIKHPRVRVRLAQNVHEGWGRVKERFGHLLSGG